MDSIRTVSMEYGDTRLSIYLIDLAEDHKAPLPDARPVMHSHFYYELHYAARGQYLYRFSDREIFLRQGEMLLIPPNVIHGAIDKESDSFTPHVLSLSLTATEAAGKFYPAFSAMLSDAAMRPMQAPASLPDQINILQQKALYGSVLGVCRLKAAAGSLISDLFHLLRPYGAEAETMPEPPCGAEVAVLLENLVNRPDIPLEQIAAAINYSPRHTARLIKNTYGVSLSEIRRSRKIK